MLSSVGCDLELHSSDICDGRSESSAAGEALLEFELVAKSALGVGVWKVGVDLVCFSFGSETAESFCFGGMGKR